MSNTVTLHDKFHESDVLTFDRNTLAWVIGLAATFILTMTVADFAAVKFLDLGWVMTPAGSLLFAFVFVSRDMLHKLVGGAMVKKVILIAIALNVLTALFMWLMTTLPSPGFRPSDAFDKVFAMAPAIVLGSVIAGLISQWVNTIAYQWFWDRGYGAWARTVWSNVISLPVDAIFFTILAFVVFPPLFGATGIELGAAAARIASGQTLFKLAIILVLTPLVSLAPTREEARELR
jgi:uncharacterized integral membrane protein (TIGR00697 family)